MRDGMWFVRAAIRLERGIVLAQAVGITIGIKRHNPRGE